MIINSALMTPSGAFIGESTHDPSINFYDCISNIYAVALTIATGAPSFWQSQTTAIDTIAKISPKLK